MDWASLPWVLTDEKRQCDILSTLDFRTVKGAIFGKGGGEAGRSYKAKLALLLIT